MTSPLNQLKKWICVRGIKQNFNIKFFISYTLQSRCKDIGLALKTRKPKYMEIGHHPGMITNEHIMIGSNY